MFAALFTKMNDVTDVFNENFNSIFGVKIKEGGGKYHLFPDGSLKNVETGVIKKKTKKKGDKSGDEYYIIP